MKVPIKAAKRLPGVRGVAAEIKHVTEEMYKRNRDLSERNKTLALLRKIDEIVLTSAGEAEEVAGMVAQAMVDDTDFIGQVSIMLVDHRREYAKAYGIALSNRVAHLDRQVGQDVLATKLPLRAQRNLIARAIRTKRALTSKSLAKLLPSHLPLSTAINLQRALGVGQFYICPMSVRSESFGVLVIGVLAGYKTLSPYQKNLIERLSGVVGIAMDNKLLYAEIQEATHRLRLANRNLKALDRAKDEFISMASHQLRTPLTTIKGYLSMIMEGDAGPIAPQQKEFLDYAFGGTQRMVSLISDLLNVSRLAAGRFIIEKQPVDLAEIVADEVRQLGSHATAKQLELRFDHPKRALPKVELDENKTRQVIMNFIDNAIYYTKQGGVYVTLEADRKCVRLKVRDTGIGVPHKAKVKLFTKFFRAENAQLARPDGTGLGLYLAKRVIEDQGGKILFDSVEGQGSTFGFEMPLKSKEL